MDEKNYKNKRLSEPCRGCLLISALVIFFISVVVATVSSLAVLRTRKWTENFLVSFFCNLLLFLQPTKQPDDFLHFSQPIAQLWIVQLRV